ncbi:DUF3825 domain-containing protein [Bifidobacterium saguinibicoloris]|uniref:DUF3825 domain-containing protein n=1 Tax=Bifidobacterium saguinibicoloris TaxID=2834433 RepID=UPI001C5760D2|nr:DUF3825 domain-containing protein [Bifidobacterium saguinibicoloris]MBW3080216.1 DUF3825 domain-containing protein [Bifidobacterium saguinibicoloris]
MSEQSTIASPRRASVIRVAIIGPTDANPTKKLIKRILEQWNDIWGAERGYYLDPRMWAPEQSTTIFGADTAQDQTNRRILDNAEIVIAVFHSRLGTPTTRNIHSGTAEEIQRAIDAHKPCHVFFRNIADTEDLVEYNRLLTYQNELRRKNYPTSAWPKSELDWSSTIYQAIMEDLQQRIDGSGPSVHAPASAPGGARRPSSPAAVSAETAEAVRKALFGDGTTTIGSIDAGQKLKGAGVTYTGYRLMEFLRMVERHGVIRIAQDPNAPTTTPQYLISPAAPAAVTPTPTPTGTVPTIPTPDVPTPAATAPTAAVPTPRPAPTPKTTATPQPTPTPSPANGLPSLKRYVDDATTFTTWTYVPPTSAAHLIARIGPGVKPLDFLNEAWGKACADHTVTVADDGESAVFTADAPEQGSDGPTPLRLTVQRSRPDSRLPFYLSRVDEAHKTDAVAAKDTLRTFAFLGNANPESPDSYQSKLDQLAAMALPENWEMPGQQHAHALLGNYITYTFHHLKKEGKIVFNEAIPSGFAAINTGLVDRGSYEPIYMVFDHNVWVYNNPQLPQWHLQGFCVLGNGQLGKQMYRNLPSRDGRTELPRRASYFRHLSDVLLDIPDPDMLKVDYDHILGDNIGRLPKAFLERVIRPDTQVRQRFGGLPDDLNDPAWKAIGQAVLEDSDAFSSLRQELERAIRQTLVRVGLDYKVALPSYYPTTDSMQFLLPICLTDHLHADVALVVQSQANGTAQAHTILTLPMAFSNARIICKPDSSWLSI